MAENLDLLGDPIPEGLGRRGRPAHIPTVPNRNQIIVLLALGWDEQKIAAALGITKPTLRKHYFRELRVRDEARARLEARMIVEQVAKAAAGDTQAYREVRRALDKVDLAEADDVYRPEPVKAPKLGKKEERQAAADEIGGMFEPGAPPARLVSH